MAYKLSVENYGKINRAEVEVTPLTLFVGDNNSGKSYLLSLIWTLFSGKDNHIIYNGLHDVLLGKYSKLHKEVLSLIEKQDDSFVNAQIVFDENVLVEIINELLNNNKEALVRSIFNYDGMKVGTIKIESTENRKIAIRRLNRELNKGELQIKIDDVKMMNIIYVKNIKAAYAIVDHIFQNLMEYVLRQNGGSESAYYLPAARTGFMLAKNTINQVGRKKTFDVFVEMDGIDDNIHVFPFPKPIIHFLDVMDNLNVQKEKEKYSDIINWITDYMAHGDIECDDENSGNIQYIPSGMKQGIPLRATSGVVTELTPLILLLKYTGFIKQICYEEPEMCLHPQLQFQMGRLLIRMINSGINVIATTHSDIIIQHINNMCQLSGSYNDNIRLESLGLDKLDLIDTSKVSIYEFKDNGEKAEVKRILPEEGKFKVNSFIDALSKILEQTIDISNIVDGEEE